MLIPKVKPGFEANGRSFSSIVEVSKSRRPMSDVRVLFMPIELSTKIIVQTTKNTYIRGIHYAKIVYL